MSEKITVLTVDDHPMFRQGIRLALSEAGDIEVVAEVASGHEALEWLRHHACRVVTLDISMPGQDGLETLKQIRYEGFPVPVIMLSIHPEEQYAVRTLKAGANGYLSKTSVPDELVAAVREVAAGGQYITTAIAGKIAATVQSDGGRMAPHEKLSDREYQILCLIGQGKTTSEIAADLSISVKTVSTHRTRILEKMRLDTNAQLMRYALDYHLVS